MSESGASDTETNPNTPNPNSSQNAMNFPTEFANQFAEFLRQSLNIPGATPISSSAATPTPTSIQPESLGDVTIKTKLSGDNYPLWANLMDRAIGGKGLTSHISGVSTAPPIADPTYPKWQQRDHCVFNWIINNIEADLVNEVSQYATAKDLWEGLAVTYGSGTDPLQVFDLHRQTNTIRQGSMTLEALWNRLQDLWISIDRREPNPMSYPSEIEKYNQIIQKQRLYQFLTALDDKYDSVKKEILNKEPLPTARKAYGIVRRESANDRVLKPTAVESKEPHNTGIGSGLAAIDRSRPSYPSHPPNPMNKPGNRRGEEDKSRLTCVHSGGKRHTKETCFHLVGFLEWWEEMKKNRAARAQNQ